MCSTADGYERRVEGTVDAVRFLGQNMGVWDSKVAKPEEEEDWEEARTILAELREVCGKS